jgi:hypothetical protein
MDKFSDLTSPFGKENICGFSKKCVFIKTDKFMAFKFIKLYDPSVKTSSDVFSETSRPYWSHKNLAEMSF